MSEPLYFNGTWRMDWGFGNPNLTAALVVCLMAAVWGLAWWHRHGFWVAVVLFAGLIVCLAHTMSRGGLLGALISGLVLVVGAPKPWRAARTAAVIAAVGVGIVAILWTGSWQRAEPGHIAQDKSVTNRLTLWRAAPRMLADAPGGWGWGRAGDVYLEWYQAPERTEEYGSLVNTHLTKIVELGLVGGSAYAAIWAIAFVVSWPCAGARWLSVPLAVLAGFWVAACFTNMARTPTLWAFPVMAGALGVWVKFRLGVMQSRAFAIVAVLAAAGVASLYVVGRNQGGLVLRGNRNGVIVGSGDVRVCVVSDGKALGRRPGRALRQRTSDAPALPGGVMLVSDVARVPRRFSGILVLAGDVDPRRLGDGHPMTVEQVWLWNPSSPPSLVRDVLPKGTSVHATFGEFCESPSRKAWADLDMVSIVDGVGDYLPEWPSLLIAGADTP